MTPADELRTLRAELRFSLATTAYVLKLPTARVSRMERGLVGFDPAALQPLRDKLSPVELRGLAAYEAAILAAPDAASAVEAVRHIAARDVAAGVRLGSFDRGAWALALDKPRRTATVRAKRKRRRRST